MQRLTEIPILLASQSPRRKQLLEEAGFRFRVMPADIDESFPDDMLLEVAAEYIARNKAVAILPHATPTEVVLAADSMVILDGVHYAKPIDEQDAIEMITALQGKTHLVVTGVCLANAAKMVTFSGHTHVSMHPMTLEEITYYVQQYKPFDKAGAYGVQEWIGLCKIAEIRGTYTNVMGLPVDMVYHGLEEFRVTE
jgi:septum formation protein